MESPGGDVLRQALINPVMVEAVRWLRDLSRAKILSDSYCREPRDFFYSALQKYRSKLYDPSNKIDPVRNTFIAGPIYDLNKLCFPNDSVSTEIPESETRKKVSILDIGCGEGYLARLLHRDIKHYLGYDDNPELINQAGNKFRDECSQLASKVISSNTEATPSDKNHDFFFLKRFWPPAKDSESEVADQVADTIERVDAISLFSVLDYALDPESFLGSLRTIVNKVNEDNGTIQKLPVFATTFDPAFFAPRQHSFDKFSSTPEKPFRTRWKQTNDTTNDTRKAVFEESELDAAIETRAPHDWERIFRRAGFHVLQQVRIPLHILPPQIGLHFVKLAQAQGCGTPRCAPVVFWVLSPRTEAEELLSFTIDGEEVTGSLVTLRPGETLELVGNLGQRVYYVQSGRLSLENAIEGTATKASTETSSNSREANGQSKSANNGEAAENKAPPLYEFTPENPIFGELEAVADPAFSRYIGHIKCVEHAKLISISIDDFNRLVARRFFAVKGEIQDKSKFERDISLVGEEFARKTAALIFRYYAAKLFPTRAPKSNPQRYKDYISAQIIAALFRGRPGNPVHPEDPKPEADRLYLSVGKDLLKFGEDFSGSRERDPSKIWLKEYVIGFHYLHDLGIIDSFCDPDKQAREHLNASERIHLYDCWAAIGLVLDRKDIFDHDRVLKFSGLEKLYESHWAEADLKKHASARANYEKQRTPDPSHDLRDLNTQTNQAREAFTPPSANGKAV